MYVFFLHWKSEHLVTQKPPTHPNPNIVRICKSVQIIGRSLIMILFGGICGQPTIAVRSLILWNGFQQISLKLLNTVMQHCTKHRNSYMEIERLECNKFFLSHLEHAHNIQCKMSRTLI